MEKGRGTIGAIAEKCGVKHPTVSRFFKSCIEKEYLTQSLDFTEKGKMMLQRHQKVVRDVRNVTKEQGYGRTMMFERMLRILIIQTGRVARSHMLRNKGIQRKKKRMNWRD